MGLIDGLLAGNDEKARQGLLERVHPLYKMYAPQWNVGLDAYDGTGGFLDGTYLWEFPRESEPDYTKRRAQARYHNYTETLVDIFLRQLTSSVERSSKDDELVAWWEDVDGRGLTMDLYASAVMGPALAAGHAGSLVDKDTTPATG